MRDGEPAARLYESCKTLLYRNWLSGSTAASAGVTAASSTRRASAGIAAASSARRASAGIAAGASSLAPGAAGRTVSAIARGAMVAPRVSPVFGRRALVGLFILVLIVG